MRDKGYVKYDAHCEIGRRFEVVSLMFGIKMSIGLTDSHSKFGVDNYNKIV